MSAPKIRMRRATPEELAQLRSGNRLTPYFKDSAVAPRRQPQGYGVGDPNTYPQGQGYRYDDNVVFDPTPGTPISSPQWANTISATLTPFTVANASTQIVPANGNRQMLIIQNLSAASDLFVNFGNAANATNGLLLVPRSGLLLDWACPNDSVYVFFNNAIPQNGTLVESVRRG